MAQRQALVPSFERAHDHEEVAEERGQSDHETDCRCAVRAELAAAEAEGQHEPRRRQQTQRHGPKPRGVDAAQILIAGSESGAEHDRDQPHHSRGLSREDIGHNGISDSGPPGRPAVIMT